MNQRTKVILNAFADSDCGRCMIPATKWTLVLVITIVINYLVIILIDPHIGADTLFVLLFVCPFSEILSVITIYILLYECIKCIKNSIKHVKYQMRQYDIEAGQKINQTRYYSNVM
jgi:hypothetical protein